MRYQQIVKISLLIVASIVLSVSGASFKLKGPSVSKVTEGATAAIIASKDDTTTIPKTATTIVSRLIDPPKAARASSK